jgi:radical SAM protein with 4Fe4S-binding SPASM domain
MTLLRTAKAALRRRKIPRPPLWVKAWHVWKSGRDKAAGRELLSAKPLRLHFEINDYCNLKCVMCSRESLKIPKDSGALSLEKVKLMAPFLRTATYVGIAGNGEPFMHVELLDILEYIRSFDCVPSIITNCTLLRQPTCDRLAKLGPSLLMASIDGGTKQVFETIRKGANFERIVENLERLRDTKKRFGTPYPVVNFITCLMRENLDDLENVVRLAKRVEAAEVNVQNLFPYHDGAWKHVVADFDAIDERILEARKLARELGIAINYSPMGFNIEKRLEHARSKGSSRVPTAGLQLNGREREIKTIGRLLVASDAENEAVIPALPAPAVALAEAPSSNGKKLAGDQEIATSSEAASAVALEEAPVFEGGKFVRGSKPALTALEGGIYDPDYVEDESAPADAAPATDEAPPFSPETHQVIAPTPAANPNAGEHKYYCQNVFQQFHVNVQGEARVCCFWTQGSLGNIKDTSPEEMWNSPKFRAARRAILQGTLPPDCKTCHHLVPFDRKAIQADTWREIKEALKL